ncbi:MAG: trehalose-6-phosphate synthase [Actinomycetota bacterium]|nr:trehalose-6-phosphate synthase [Actinomycetota bacterium]
MGDSMEHGLIAASNRGPVSWRRADDGELVPERGAGGLVTALGGALQDEPGTWVSVAMSEEDREVAVRHDGEPFEVKANGSRFRLRLLDVGDRFEDYYNTASNRLLWFTLHELWAAPYEPSGIGWPAAYRDAYAPVNDRVARAVIDAARESDGEPEIYLQDYHLCLAGGLVRKALPDAPLLHYLHTPWVGPRYLRRLPDRMVHDILDGLLSADVVGFSSPLWSESFRRCARDLAGATIDGEAVLWDGRRTAVRHFTLGIDETALEAVAGDEATRRAGEEHDRELDGRRLLVRVDRTDLSKNILRGLQAYRLLLERHPDHQERVWHYVHLNPSRQGVPQYREYLGACRAEAERIRERFGAHTLSLFVGDDYPRAVAALQRFDVLFANPSVDGMNLVAKEGSVLNERNGVLVLSRHAGAASLLAEGALLVNPYDVESQAEALHRALTMDDEERASRAQVLQQQARLGTPHEWFAAQRDALRQAVEARDRGT